MYTYALPEHVGSCSCHASLSVSLSSPVLSPPQVRCLLRLLRFSLSLASSRTSRIIPEVTGPPLHRLSTRSCPSGFKQAFYDMISSAILCQTCVFLTWSNRLSPRNVFVSTCSFSVTARHPAPVRTEYVSDLSALETRACTLLRASETALMFEVVVDAEFEVFGKVFFRPWLSILLVPSFGLRIPNNHTFGYPCAFRLSRPGLYFCLLLELHADVVGNTRWQTK